MEYKKAIYLLDELGDTANADHYEKWESQLVQAARANLFNIKTDSFSDRLKENVMAILLGVATPQKYSIIYQSIIKPGGSAWTVPHGKGLSDSEVMSPY